MRYERIMVAVDGSESSELALKDAIQLTKDLSATLKVIYVVDQNIVQFSDSAEVDYIWEAYKKEADEYLQKKNQLIKKKGISFETSLVTLKTFEGRLAEKILKEAKDWNADLLVIGTHGHNGVSRFFLGSVAEKLIRLAILPILLVRGK